MDPEGLPLFTGKEDILWWFEEHEFYCWNHYYDTQSEWVYVAIQHLDGEALDWVFQQTWSELNWSTLKEAMLRDFAKQVGEETKEMASNHATLSSKEIHPIVFSSRPQVQVKFDPPIIKEFREDIHESGYVLKVPFRPIFFSRNELHFYTYDTSGTYNINLRIGLNDLCKDWGKEKLGQGFIDDLNRPPPEPPPIKMKTRTLRTRFVLMGAGIDTINFAQSVQAQLHDPRPTRQRRAPGQLDD